MGDTVLLLQQELITAPDLAVQCDTRSEQRRRTALDRTVERREEIDRGGERTHAVHIAQSAASLFQIGLEEIRDVAAPPLAFGRYRVEDRDPPGMVGAPVVAGAPPELGRELALPRDQSCVEESEGGIQIAIGHLDRTVERVDAVVELDALFPDRVPDPLRDLVDVVAAAMQERNVEITAGREFLAPVAPDGDQRDAGNVSEQLGQPGIDDGRVSPAERRALQALVGQELFAAFGK